MDTTTIDMTFKLGFLTAAERALILRVDGTNTVENLGLDSESIAVARGLVHKRVVHVKKNNMKTDT